MRCFIAIGMFAKIERIYANFQDEFKNCIDANYPNSFHITLKFLGDVGENKIPKIQEKLKQIKIIKFALKLDKMGCFPNKNDPKVLWMGLQGEVEKLKEMQGEVEQALKEFNFKSDHNFHPHITLARIKEVKNQQEFIQKLSLKVPAYCFDIYKFILYQSKLTECGPVYDVIEEYDLSLD